jgi:hypothetical protein
MRTLTRCFGSIPSQDLCISAFSLAICASHRCERLKRLMMSRRATGVSSSVDPESVQRKSSISRQAPPGRRSFLFGFFAVSLRILLQCTRTEMPRFMFHSRNGQRDAKTGASRGDNRLVAGLASCERAVCRVARLGGVQSRSSRFIGPQKRGWTSSFSTNYAWPARAIGAETCAGRLRLRRKSRQAMSAICPYLCLPGL